MPKVSIIIPTLNRAHLLRSALKSALEQDYKDIEILVSDDCSDDDTRDVATKTGDERVRYVRTPKRIDMAQSFEFALQQARGEYLTFLTDDSYLTRDCIAIAMREMERAKVQLVVWRHTGYFDHDWLEPLRRNVMYIPKCEYGVERLSSRASLQKWLLEMRAASAAMPRSINSLCHRSVIEAALKRQGEFFLPPAPDHSSGAAMMLNTDSYVLVDEPLVVDGVTKESIGPSQSFNLGESAQAFYKSFDKTMEEITFLGLPTTPAIIARSFENVRQHNPECPPLVPRTLIAEMVESISKLQVYGAKVDPLWATLDKYVRAKQPELRGFAARQRIRHVLRWRAVKLARSNRLLSNFERLRSLHIVQGSKEGFTDIEGAARVLERENQKRRGARA